MMRDELDRIISEQDEIMPSSGFVSSVMEAVRQESAAPKPIPFPWMRALPVFAALGLVLTMVIAGLVQVTRMPATAAQTWTLPPVVASAVHALAQANAGWIAFALLLTLLSTVFSIRLAGGKR
jgi:hypothetical protein